MCEIQGKTILDKTKNKTLREQLNMLLAETTIQQGYLLNSEGTSKESNGGKGS